MFSVGSDYKVTDWPVRRKMQTGEENFGKGFRLFSSYPQESWKLKTGPGRAVWAIGALI